MITIKDLKEMPQRYKYFGDSAIIFILIAGLVIFSLKYINFSSLPYEDAAMLMRYSVNLGNGHGMAWNIGEKPIDGATDFLFTVILAGVYKLGISIEQSVRLIDYSSHFLTMMLIYYASRKFFHASLLTSFISAAFFAIGPGLSYTAAYFGTPFFALFGCLTWIFALRIMKGKTDQLSSFLFAFSGLILGLIRPEGVILAVLILISIGIYLGWRKSFVSFMWFTGIFLLLGGAYFVWRYSYFGYPLPNPFYKKGGGVIYWDSFFASINNVFSLGLPFWIIYLFGFRNKELSKQVFVYLFPVFVFASAFILLSNEMNFGSRFQYVVLPIILISWHPFFENLAIDLSLPKISKYSIRIKLILLTILCFSFYTGFVFYRTNRITTYSKDGRYDIAIFLNQFQAKGYTIATSEAGLLPLYSGWKAIDTWGLNDQWIAHNGQITAEYLNNYKPEIITFHAYFSPQNPLIGQTNTRWDQMDLVLKEYAEKNNYTLAGVFGENPYSDTQYYYVKNDFPDAKVIISTIKNFGYYYPPSEVQSLNFAYLPQ